MASRETYSIACIDLFRRLWVELEQLSEETAHPCAATPASGPRAEMLRLELALLIDAACSERWRRQLDVSQRQSLRSTLEEVLGALNSSSELVLPDAIVWSQNRLFDAVLESVATADFNLKS
jgi:hypothetical protein